MRRGGAGITLKTAIYPAVGNLPASAEDGTLAVITATPLGIITLDTAQPTAAVAGDLWLSTLFVGRAAIQLSEKPLARAYPFTAAQYIGGVWTFTRAFVYHGGWVELRAWLYDMGNNHPENGGAWAVDYIESGYGSVVFNAQNIALTRTIAGSRTSVKKADPIDFTPANTLKLVLKKTSTAATGYVNVIVDNGTTTLATLTASTWAANEERTLSLDVSALNGAYYLRVRVMDAATFTLSQAWLE